MIKKRYLEIWKNIKEKDSSIIDIGGRSKELLRYAPKGFVGEYKNFDILEGNNIQKPLKEKRKFDYVIFSHVIEHLQNPGIALDNIKNLLKNNGTLILLIPNCLSIRKVIRNILKFKLESFGGFETHYTSYNIDSIKNLLEFKGFKIKKMYFLDPLTNFFWRFSEELLIVATK